MQLRLKPTLRMIKVLTMTVLVLTMVLPSSCFGKSTSDFSLPTNPRIADGINPTKDSAKQSLETLDEAPDFEEFAEIYKPAVYRDQHLTFVLKKLLPTSDKKHSASSMLNLLATGTCKFVYLDCKSKKLSPTDREAFIALVQTMFPLHSAHLPTPPELSMLQRMLWERGDTSFMNIRAYKASMNQRTLALKTYDEQQKRVPDVRALNRSDQLDVQLKLQRQETDSSNLEVDRAHHTLVELAGEDAVHNLDILINRAESNQHL